MNPVLGETLPAPVRKTVVIIENVLRWQVDIARVVQKVLGDVEVIFASTASNGMQAIAGMRAREAEIALVLTDLHLSEDPNENGDSLLLQLIESAEPLPPVALVSGTLTGNARHDLVTRTGIPTLEKDAFLPANDDLLSTRTALTDRLQRVANREERPLADRSVIAAGLRAMRGRLTSCPGLAIFVDEIKPVIADIAEKYETYLNAIGAGDRFKVSLNDGKGHALHEFKNDLRLVINDLQGLEDCPQALLAELTSLHVSINQYLLNKDKEPQTTVDVVDLAESVCRNFRAFHCNDRRINFSSDKDHINVKADPVKLRTMLIEMIHNALAHSEGEIKVQILADENIIDVINDSPAPLPFTVFQNDICSVEGDEEGNLGISSAAGSGKGVKFLADTAKTMGLQFYLERLEDVGQVRASLAWQADDSGIDEYVEVLAEPEADEELRSLPNIIFICHDRNPEGTFEELIPKRLSGYRHMTLAMPTYDQGEFLAQRANLLDETALVVIHMDVSGYRDYLTPLASQYPHLVFLPVSTLPSSLSVRSTLETVEQSRAYAKLCGGVRNVLTEEMVEEYLKQEGLWSAELMSDVVDGMYRKDYSTKVWEVLVGAAQYIAKKKKYL